MDSRENNIDSCNYRIVKSLAIEFLVRESLKTRLGRTAPPLKVVAGPSTSLLSRLFLYAAAIRDSVPETRVRYYRSASNFAPVVTVQYTKTGRRPYQVRSIPRNVDDARPR